MAIAGTDEFIFQIIPENNLIDYENLELVNEGIKNVYMNLGK